jgi:hypothetical protein
VPHVVDCVTLSSVARDVAVEQPVIFMRSTILGGDSIWVPSLLIRSSRNNSMVLWGTMVEMVELHIVD